MTFEPRPADVGEVVAVEVTGTKPGFEAATRTSAPTAPVAEGTIEPGTPTITGDPVVGGTLTADPGTWDDAVALAYQWLVDGSPVADETGTSYTPRPEDVDLPVTVQVTGTRTGYASETVTSEPTAPVAAAVLDGPVPTISGRPVVDRDLVADPGEWGEGVTLGYQWLVGGTPVAGATEQTYRPTAAAVGGTVTVEVTGTAEGFAPATRTSEPTAPVEKATLTAPRRPKVGGTPRVGRQLKAKPGDWGDGVTLRYRWFADGERIEGRTGQRLRLTKDERGARIKVRVVGTRPGYTTDRETSRLTKKVRPRR